MRWGILALAVLASLVVPSGASARPFLPKAQAERATRTVALRSAHRIWRVSDTRVESMICERISAPTVLCGVTVGLHYSADECVPPVEFSATYIISKISRTKYSWQQYHPWEVDPAMAAVPCEAELEA